MFNKGVGVFYIEDITWPRGDTNFILKKHGVGDPGLVG